MARKLIKYFKHRKINKYLKSKDERLYNILDKLLKCYIDGRLQMLLNSYNYSNIQFYPHISKRGNLLQVDFGYRNLHINIEFDDNNYDYIIYLPGISAEDFDKGITTKAYDPDFNIESFFEAFHHMLQKDSRLEI